MKSVIIQIDKTQIPNFEKNAGTECFTKGDYFEATRHYAKVQFESTLRLQWHINF